MTAGFFIKKKPQVQDHSELTSNLDPDDQIFPRTITEGEICGSSDMASAFQRNQQGHSYESDNSRILERQFDDWERRGNALDGYEELPK